MGKYFILLLVFFGLFAPCSKGQVDLNSNPAYRVIQQTIYPDKIKELNSFLKKETKIPVEQKIEILSNEISNLEASGESALALVLCHLALQDIYTEYNQAHLGIPHLEQAMQVAAPSADGSEEWNIALGKIHAGLAYNFYKEYQTDKAIEEENKALGFLVKTNDSLSIAQSLNALGIRYSEVDDSEKALTYYDQAMPYLKSNRYQRLRLRNQFCKAVDLNILKRNSESRDLLASILPEMKISNHSNYNIAALKLAELETDAGNFQKAETLYNEALENIPVKNDWPSYATLHLKLAELFEKKKDFPKSIYHFKLATGYKDSINQNSLAQQNQLANSQFQELTRIQQIKELEMEAQIESASFWSKLAWLALGFLAICFGSYFVVNRHNQNKREQAILNLKNKEIHQPTSEDHQNITHELRTPIAVIMGQLEELKKEKLNQRASSLVDTTQQNMEDLLAKINQELEAKNPVSQHNNDAVGDLISLAENTFEFVKKESKDKRIDWSFSTSHKELVKEFDLNKLRVVLENAAMALAEYSNDGSSIHLNIDANKNDIFEITIEEKGKGIPPKLAEQMLLPNNNVEDEVLSKIHPLLLLSKDFCKTLNGSIEWLSKGENASVIQVQIPIPERQKETPSKSDKEKNLPTLLLIEDHPDLSKFITDVLSNQYTIQSFEYGNDGLEWAIKNIPDIIISDVMLPDTNGFEITKSIKSNMLTDHIPILILTARNDEGAKMEGLEARADAFLTKPFKTKELKLTLTNLLQNRRRLQMHYKMEDTKVKTKENPFIDLVMETLEECHGDSNFNVDLFAQKLRISRVQLFKKTKALLDATPSNLIKTYRLEKAHKMLQSSEMSVSQIAYECGFSSPEYFSTVYKDQYNSSPSQVRKS